jgi:predicted dehydrogenase
MKTKVQSKDVAPIRVGIVGLGRAGYGMQAQELAARPDKYAIVAGCDIVASQRKRFAEKFPSARVYAKAAELIADPNVELVTVATRTPTHVEIAIEALRAGKYVMCEKPIAVSYKEAKKLQAADRKYPGLLFIRQNRRFEPCFNDVCDIIRSGILGDIYEIRLCRHQYARRDDWQTVIAEGGGQLLNWGPHIVDHALQFLESPVASVRSDLRRIAAVGDAEDHVHLLLKRETGPLVEIEISGGAALKAPVYFVIGTRGTLVSDDERTLRLRYLDPKAKLPRRRATTALMETFGSREVLPWVEEERPVRTDIDPDCIWDDLHAHLTKGAPFRVTTDEALEVMRVLDLAARTRK